MIITCKPKIGNAERVNNNFFAQFPTEVVDNTGTPIAITGQAQGLPQMNGAGMVRNMNEAASLKLKRQGAINSVAGHVRKQGLVATFSSQKWPRKCSKYLGQVKSQQWTARLGGEFVGLSVFNDASSSTGQKLAISKADGSASITISNFDVAAAKSSAGYLGIKLDTTEKLALLEGASQNVWQDYDFNASSLAGKSSTIVEGTGQTFSISLSAAAKAGDTITLALAGAASDKFKAILGDDTVAANGAVLTLVEGQTSVSFALVQEGDVTQDLAGTLSASYQGTGADANEQQSASSNSWALNLKDTGETSKTYTGDQRAKLIGTEIDQNITPDNSKFGTYKWAATSWAADGSLTGGIAQADFADVIYGSTGNDKIDGRGGNDALDGGDGRNENAINSVAGHVRKQGLVATFCSEKRACRRLKLAKLANWRSWNISSVDGFAAAHVDLHSGQKIGMLAVAGGCWQCRS